MRSAHPAEAKSERPGPRPDSNPTDLFPETLPPVLPALWPEPGTRADEALEVLLTGAAFTQADYLKTSQSWRLSAAIKSLRYDGWGIIVRLVTRPRCRRQIAEYRLDFADPATKAAIASRGGR